MNVGMVIAYSLFGLGLLVLAYGLYRADIKDDKSNFPEKLWYIGTGMICASVPIAIVVDKTS